MSCSLGRGDCTWRRIQERHAGILNTQWWRHRWGSPCPSWLGRLHSAAATTLLICFLEKIYTESFVKPSSPPGKLKFERNKKVNGTDGVKSCNHSKHPRDKSCVSSKPKQERLSASRPRWVRWSPHESHCTWVKGGRYNLGRGRKGRSPVHESHRQWRQQR